MVYEVLSFDFCKKRVIEPFVSRTLLKKIIEKMANFQNFKNRNTKEREILFEFVTNLSIFVDRIASLCKWVIVQTYSPGLNKRNKSGGLYFFCILGGGSP